MRAADLLRRRIGRLPRHTRWSAVTAVVVASILVGTQTASAGPPPLVPIAPPTGPIFPTPPGLLFESFTDNGALMIGKNTVSKAKTTFRIPQTLIHAYTTLSVTPDFVDTNSDGYVVSPAGLSQRYGYFAPIRVTTLAFGAIPVSATVQLSQPLLPTGYLDPLKIRQRSLQSNGTSLPTYVTGRLLLRLSDVTVDQVPLPVGPDCGTAAPVTMSLSGAPPAYPGPVDGGFLSGTVDVGAFARCGTGSDDLDPLFTGMLSAPSNPLIVSQGQLGLWVYPQSCPLGPVGGQGCVLPPPIK